jgi:outer membrane receptor for ferrienterochelin and colicin
MKHKFSVREYEVADRRVRIVTRKLLLMVVICFTAFCTLNGQSAQTGNLSGTIVVTDSTGSSVVPGAKVVLAGQTTLETSTDQAGSYRFQNVPPGSYTITATSPGLQGEKSVEIVPGSSVELPLEVKPTELKTDVTVQDTYQDVKTAAAAETVQQKTIEAAPNVNERFESVLPLVPGVVRGPDGRINLKGARANQNGALVNSANVTDPATGSMAINLPVDVVSSVQVISNPYDPQYGKLTGAVSTAETKTGNFEKYHFTVQNILPRARKRGDSIVGIGAATPRMTVSGPLWKDHIAFLQSIEYRFLRTPVNSLPPMERDTKLEGFNSYSQADINISPKQTATVSLAVYPQKLGYLGLNTFTPQEATADLHQRGFQTYAQHRYVFASDSMLTSQFTYKVFDVDITAPTDNPFEMWVDTTHGGFFDRQARRTNRADWQESVQFPGKQFLGTHQVKVGFDLTDSDFDGRQAMMPVTLMDAYGKAIERITFSSATSFNKHQDESSVFAMDQWTPTPRVSVSYGLRFDNDTVSDSTHVAPRGGILIALTKDGKTLLKGGAGMFYDRVPLVFSTYNRTPNRTVSLLAADGSVTSSTAYVNRVNGDLDNPRSTAWNVALERQLLAKLNVRLAYEQRNTSRDFVLSPTTTTASNGTMLLSNSGHDSYREFQVAGRYNAERYAVNASYTRSRAYGDLNDPFLFLGNYPQAVIQPNQRGRLSFDAPNRFLFWGEVNAPWKLSLMPVYDLHTGFPYSAWDQYHQYVGPRNKDRYPWFESFDLQVLRPISIPMHGKRLRAKAGIAVFNLFNHFNPRDVQNNNTSSNFGTFYNDAWREYRGKLVFEF